MTWNPAESSKEFYNMSHGITVPTMNVCYCIGPQNGQPKCPCAMRGVIERDGRWIETERDLGPVLQSLDVKKGSDDGEN